MKKQIKRILLVASLAVCLILLASCTFPMTQTHTCADANGDTKCDTCQAYVAPKACTAHIDNNNDGVCDRAGCNGVVLKEMLDVTFENVTKTYNGKEWTIEVEGAPEGAEIDYDKSNKQTNAGKYTINAYITCDGYVDTELTATLTIKPKKITVEWGELPEFYPSNGKAPEIPCTVGSGVIEGDEVEIELDFGKCDFTEKGTFTAKAVSKNENYEINTKNRGNEIKFVIGDNIHTITFETNINGREIDPEVVLDGEPVDAPRALTKFGHTFMGWYNGETEWSFDDPVTESMNLVAKWELTEFKINYHLNGGTNNPNNPDTFTIETEDNLLVPSKEGSVFLGWYTDSALSDPTGDLGTLALDIDLYAKWADDDFVELESGKTISSSSTAITLSEVAVNGGFKYTFAATIKSFDSEKGAIYIGRGKDTTDGSFVKITADKVYVSTVGAGGSLTTQEQSHIREMVGYIVVDVTVRSGTATITLVTADGSSTFNSVPWLGRNGEIFFDSENVELTDAAFGWNTSVYDELTWIIGDETIGSAEFTSFTYQLSDAKYGNFLAIGATGLDAASALENFKEACEIGHPKYAIWSFRADTSENYDATLAEFVAFCKEKGITPILTTQFSTPDFDNTARNEAVRSSGERYIDFADLEKYESVISNGVITRDGARSVYAKFMEDFPEIVAAAATMRTEKADTVTGVSASLLYPENYDMSSDITYEADGKTVKLKYGEFEKHRKAGKDEILASAITMKGNAIKDGKYMIVSAKIDGTLTEDQTILIGHGYMSSTGKWIEINGKDILTTGYQSWGGAHINPSTKQAHGLTIKNFITVVISCDSAHAKSISIYTDGGFKVIAKEVNGNAGDMFVASAGVDLTDVTMSWTCADYAKDVWVFGDSYLSLGDPARWPTHLRYAGYYTSLMVGASGMSAEEGLANLEDAIQYGKPKYIVWLEGMNNGEKNGEKNKGYHESVKRLFEICEEYDIVPVIATIPNCPVAFHELKNNAIYNGLDEFAGKSYRIIDWARAVEDFSNDTKWYEGMLHTDNVHPTNLGAKALYMQLVVDFPEILGGWDSTVYTKEEASLASGTSLTIETPDDAEKNRVIAFTADFRSDFTGKISIGNGKNEEGGTWIEIDTDYVTVYSNIGGVATEVLKKSNSVMLDNLINVKIHVVGESANVEIMSAGVTDDSMGNRVYNFDVAWSTAGDAFASASSLDLDDATLKWYSHK